MFFSEQPSLLYALYPWNKMAQQLIVAPIRLISPVHDECISLQNPSEYDLIKNRSKLKRWYQLFSHSFTYRELCVHVSHAVM